MTNYFSSHNIIVSQVKAELKKEYAHNKHLQISDATEPGTL